MSIVVTDMSFASDVLAAKGPILVEFWAEWCDPCRILARSLEEIATELSGKVMIARLNIDENPTTPGKYGVRGIPTLMVFMDGKVTATKVGAMSKQALKSWVDVEARLTDEQQEGLALQCAEEERIQAKRARELAEREKQNSEREKQNLMSAKHDRTQILNCGPKDIWKLGKSIRELELLFSLINIGKLQCIIPRIDMAPASGRVIINEELFEKIGMFGDVKGHHVLAQIVLGTKVTLCHTSGDGALLFINFRPDGLIAEGEPLFVWAEHKDLISNLRREYVNGVFGEFENLPLPYAFDQKRREEKRLAAENDKLRRLLEVISGDMNSMLDKPDRWQKLYAKLSPDLVKGMQTVGVAARVGEFPDRKSENSHLKDHIDLVSKALEQLHKQFADEPRIASQLSLEREKIEAEKQKISDEWNSISKKKDEISQEWNRMTSSEAMDDILKD